MSLAVTDLDKVLKRLVEVGSRRKWICYEELNTCLPDEFVEPLRPVPPGDDLVGGGFRHGREFPVAGRRSGGGAGGGSR